MRYGPMLIAVAAGVFVGGCTSVGDTPATAPSTTAPIAATTTSVITTTTALITTTTIDRLTEITAIFEDLERRRLQAIYDQDEEAFRALYANAEYLERNLELFAVLTVIEPQGFETTTVDPLVVGSNCIAAEIERDYGGAIADGELSTRVHVIERVDSQWGISWIGEGWACDGPHPFS